MAPPSFLADAVPPPPSEKQLEALLLQDQLLEPAAQPPVAKRRRPGTASARSNVWQQQRQQQQGIAALLLVGAGVAGWACWRWWQSRKGHGGRGARAGQASTSAVSPQLVCSAACSHAVMRRSQRPYAGCGAAPLWRAGRNARRRRQKEARRPGLRQHFLIRRQEGRPRSWQEAGGGAPVRRAGRGAWAHRVEHRVVAGTDGHPPACNTHACVLCSRSRRCPRPAPRPPRTGKPRAPCRAAATRCATTTDGQDMLIKRVVRCSHDELLQTRRQPQEGQARQAVAQRHQAGQGARVSALPGALPRGHAHHPAGAGITSVCMFATRLLHAGPRLPRRRPASSPSAPRTRASPTPASPSRRGSTPWWTTTSTLRRTTASRSGKTRARRRTRANECPLHACLPGISATGTLHAAEGAPDVTGSAHQDEPPGRSCFCARMRGHTRPPQHTSPTPVTDAATVAAAAHLQQQNLPLHLPLGRLVLRPARRVGHTRTGKPPVVCVPRAQGS